MLFHAGDATAIDEACKRSPIGKLLPDEFDEQRATLEPLMAAVATPGPAGKD